MLKAVFSEFELQKMGFKFQGEEEYTSVNCVGSSEETMDAKIITKKCRGVVFKEVVKGTGTGKIKISAHFPYDVYVKMYGMSLGELIEGVNAYGRNSRHKNFSVVQDVYDEDGNEKLKAYPNCIVETGVARKINNGDEEVAELELEAAVIPDKFGNGMYEVPVADLTDQTVAQKWMSEFTPDLVSTIPR